MKIEYMPMREKCQAPLIHVEVVGLDQSELSTVSGAVSINDLHMPDISLVKQADGVVLIQGQGMDLLVSVRGTAKDTSLASVFHLLMGSSFAPGLIGVDWEDVCSLLAAGRNGTLSAIEIDQELGFEALIRDLVEPLQGRIRSVICCLYLPEARFFASSVNVINELIKGLESITGEFVLGVPIVTTNTPILSLMLITD